MKSWLVKIVLEARRKKSYAQLMVVQIMLKTEEFALGMEHRSNNAAVKDVQIMLEKEEFARSMGQRSVLRYAALKDVIIK